MVRVVGYARVSSEDQAQKDLSIPAQIKAIEKYVNDQPEMQLLQMFKDEGVSAYASADKRRGFMEMISFAKENNVKFILVHKLDRFSRNREESVIFKSLLNKYGVSVKSLCESFDSDTPSGFLFEGIIEVINQFYSMNLSMETRKGMAENASRGFLNGGSVPYGYTKIDVPGIGDRVHKKLALGDPMEVATIRKIFEWATNDGLGAKAIVNRLTAEGIVTASGKPWCKQRIGQYLNNPVYYGATVWNRTNSKSHKQRPESEWMIVENTHDPIVSKEMYFRRKAMAAGNIGKAFPTVTQKEEWLLSKIIRCGKCGQAYVGIRRKKVSKLENERIEYMLKRYVCSGYINQKECKCGSFYIDKDFLESAVLRAIQHEIAKPGRLDEIEQSIQAKLMELKAGKSGEEQRLAERLKELSISIERYYDAIGAGMDVETCKVKIDELQREKRFLDAEFKQKYNVEILTEALKRDLDICRKLIRNFDSEAETIPFERLRMVVIHFVESIEIIDESIARINMRIPKLTTGKTLKPPMAKKTRVEVELDAQNKKIARPDLNQVGLLGLPGCNRFHEFSIAEYRRAHFYNIRY